MRKLVCVPQWHYHKIFGSVYLLALFVKAKHSEWREEKLAGKAKEYFKICDIWQSKQFYFYQFGRIFARLFATDTHMRHTAAVLHISTYKSNFFEGAEGLGEGIAWHAESMATNIPIFDIVAYVVCMIVSLYNVGRCWADFTITDDLVDVVVTLVFLVAVEPMFFMLLVLFVVVAAFDLLFSSHVVLFPMCRPLCVSIHAVASSPLPATHLSSSTASVEQRNTAHCDNARISSTFVVLVYRLQLTWLSSMTGFSIFAEILPSHSESYAPHITPVVYNLYSALNQARAHISHHFQLDQWLNIIIAITLSVCVRTAAQLFGYNFNFFFGWHVAVVVEGLSLIAVAFISPNDIGTSTLCDFLLCSRRSVVRFWYGWTLSAVCMCFRV